MSTQCGLGAPVKRAMRLPIAIGLATSITVVAAASFASDASTISGSAETPKVLTTTTSSSSSSPTTKSRKLPAGLVPFSSDTVASTLALGSFRGKSIAIVADEDDSMLHLFDLDGPREVGTTKLSGKPGQILIADDGRVFVAIRDKGQVAVLDPNPDPKVNGGSLAFIERASIATGGEPIGLALTPDGLTLLVTSGWTGELYGHSTKAPHARSLRLDVAREPRSIAVSLKSGRAIVSHAVGGTLSVLTLGPTDNMGASTISAITATGRPRGYVPPAIAATVTPSSYKIATAADRPSTQGYALAKFEGKVYAPHVFADPERPATYYGDGTQAFGILTIDDKTGTLIEASREITPRPVNTRKGFSTHLNDQCLLPRAAAIDPERRRLLVGCAGSDVIFDYDAVLDAPVQIVKRLLRADDSPAAIAIDRTGNNAIVWSQLARTLAVVPLMATSSVENTIKPPVVARASGFPISTEIARGRRIFHTGGDGRISNDGRACATCHPDGRDDGLAWTTPDGPRQTAMLAGRVADTAPYGWTRAAPTLEAYVADTIHRLNGHGLPEADMRDLVSYVKSLEPPPRAIVDSAIARRGRAIFESPQAACSTCHSGTTFTDGMKHDVGSASLKRPTDQTFETPSLRFVGRTAPYFHDGRYATLQALLSASDGKMGRVAHLSPSDRDALEVFLRSL